MKFDFLKFAIEDTQETIRFIDAKTAYIITLLGFYIAAFFISIEKFIQCFSGYDIWLWLSLGIFLALLLICVIITSRIIKPTSNPVNNINLNGLSKPDFPFFLPENTYSNKFYFPFINSESHKLQHNFKDHHNKCIQSNDDDILKSLNFELLKVSYIRNIKHERFNILLWFVVGATVAFFVSYLIFSVETQHLLVLFEQIKKC